MSKIKLLIILVVGLMILNIALLMVFFFNSPPRKHQRPPIPKNIIIKKLAFNDKQVIEYEKLIEHHVTAIKKKEVAIQQNKKALTLLLKTNDYKTKDSLINNISHIHAEIEHINFKHFQDMKKLCNSPEQIHKFNQLTDNLAKLFRRKRKK